MDEKVAQDKFACPACGGEAVWNAARQTLVCPFCGTESQAPRAEGAIAEHDLADALRGLARGGRGAWKPAGRSVRCRSCNAVSVLDAARQAQNCGFCGSAQLVPYEETAPALRPESVVPFRVAEPEARERIRRWYGRLWLAPSSLKRRAMTDTVRGVYLPYWTFDARVHARWTAEAGRYVWRTETFAQNGRTGTRQVRDVQWFPASGTLDHAFDDELVCASVGVHPSLLRQVEPFPTDALRPWDAAYVAGWVVERYQIDLAQATERSRAQMDARLAALCAAQVPGDTHRNLAVRADWSGQTFKHVLAPVWLLSYTVGAKSYQCVVNGATGAIAGEYPKSPWKIALLVLTAIVVAWIVLSSQGR